MKLVDPLYIELCVAQLTRPSPALAKAVARRPAASVSPSAEMMEACFTCSAFSTRNLLKASDVT